MSDFFNRGYWDSPIGISPDLIDQAARTLTESQRLDNWSELLDSGQPYRYDSNQYFDYSQWDAALEAKPVLTAEMFQDILLKNAIYFYGALHEETDDLTYAEIYEVARRYPRIFEVIREDSNLTGTFFSNQLKSARNLVNDNTAFLWVLGEWFSGDNVNWWSNSIPFVKDAVAAELNFDQVIRYTTHGVRDVTSIEIMVKQDIDPRVGGALFAAL